MSDHYDRGLGPLAIIGALMAIGAMGGSRGQLMLKRLKRLGSRMALVSVLLSPLTLLLPWPHAGIWFGMAVMLAILGGTVWCYAAFARWLTRDNGVDNQ